MPSIRIDAWKPIFGNVTQVSTVIVGMRRRGQRHGFVNTVGNEEFLTRDTYVLAAVSVHFGGVRLQPVAITFELLMLAQSLCQLSRICRPGDFEMSRRVADIDGLDHPPIIAPRTRKHNWPLASQR